MLQRYRRLFPYLRRYQGRYALGALCVVLSVALKMTVPKLLGDSLDEIREGEGGNAVIWDTVQVAAWLMVAAACASAVIRTASRLLILGNSRLAIHDLRKDIFAHLLGLAPSFYVRHQTGHIMSRLVNDMQNVQGLLGPVFMYLVETFVIYGVGLFFLLSVDPVLTLWVLLPFPLFLWAARKLAGRIQVGTRRGQEQLAAISAKVDESLSGQRVIKALALEDHDRARFDTKASDYRDTMLEVARIRGSLVPGMGFLALLSTFILLSVGGPMVSRDEISLGELLAMQAWLLTIAGPTATLGFVISSLQRGAAALARIGEVMDMEQTIAIPAEPDPRGLREGALKVRDLKIHFPPLREQPHLSGSLPDDARSQTKGRDVLRGVSFALRPGERLGIVGATGSGKTTLLRALSRQLEVPRGTVFYDGIDILDIAPLDLRRAVGVVPQEAFLFSLSLADNIALGRPEATREEIQAALRAAQLEADLVQLPEGLDTLVGERGVKLSGGQRQRTALARLLLLDPKVVLLDDTMSAVDTDTAERILKTLRTTLRGRSSLTVAHRVASVQDCDRILVLDDGRIAESGTHAELLERGGIYHSLYQKQQRSQQLLGELRELGGET